MIKAPGIDNYKSKSLHGNPYRVPIIVPATTNDLQVKEYAQSVVSALRLKIISPIRDKNSKGWYSVDLNRTPYSRDPVMWFCPIRFSYKITGCGEPVPRKNWSFGNPEKPDVLMF